VSYDFMEVSFACSDVEVTTRFLERLFDAKVLFRGRMAGEPFVRLVACGITFVLRQQDPWPAAPPDHRFRSHLGLKVDDLATAIDDLKAKGAKFVLEPSQVTQLQQKEQGGQRWLETTYVAPPLTLETLPDSGYRHDVAILEGPDHLWIELNEVHLPEGADWF